MTGRGILYTIVFVLWTIGNCLFYLPLLWSSHQRVLRAVVRYVRSLAWLEKKVLGLDYELIGNLPRKGPALIAFKHQSAWETFKLHILFDDPAVVLKQELLNIPVWGKFAAKLNMIPIDRKAKSKAIEKMLRASKQAMENNRPIIIFPQGTRVPPGLPYPYHSGIGRLYEATGLPIIPVALNSGLFWPRHFFRKRPGKITMQVLEVIPSGFSAKEAVKLLEQRLEAASSHLLKDKI